MRTNNSLGCAVTLRGMARVYWMILAGLACSIIFFNLILQQYGIAVPGFLTASNHTDVRSSSEVDVIRVVPDGFSTVIRPSVTCQDRDVELVICVPVSRGNSAGRQVIRETWGSFSNTGQVTKKEINTTAGGASGNSSVAQDKREKSNNSSGPHIFLVFFIGSSLSPFYPAEQNELMLEAERYQDIFQEDYIDSYENLTLKSLSVLKWVSIQCPNARFVAKIDDDMYVNIPLLLQVLHSTQDSLSSSSSPNSSASHASKAIPPQPFVLGSFITKAQPIRSKTSKWYTPAEKYNKTYYPDYLSGTAYSMSGGAAAKLYQASRRVPLFWMEDIYVTGMCRQESGVKIIGDSRFIFSKPKATGCTFQKLISGHRYTHTQMRNIHKELFNPLLKC